MSLPSQEELNQYWGGGWSEWMSDHGVSWADAEPDYDDCPIYDVDDEEMGEHEECSSCVFHSCPKNPMTTDIRREKDGGLKK